MSAPADHGAVGAPDPVHLTEAIRDDCLLLPRNAGDFNLLHDLVLASGGGHPGLLLVHLDNDPTRDLTPRGIATAIARLESSGLALADQLHVLNRWR